MVEGIAIGLVVAAVIGVARWGWVNRESLPASIRGWREKKRSARVADERARRREAEIAAAQDAGTLIGVSRRGSEPVEVTFSDGSRSYYFRDLERYKNALSAGRYPPDRTFCTTKVPRIAGEGASRRKS